MNRSTELFVNMSIREHYTLEIFKELLKNHTHGKAVHDAPILADNLLLKTSQVKDNG